MSPCPSAFNPMKLLKKSSPPPYKLNLSSSGLPLRPSSVSLSLKHAFQNPGPPRNLASKSDVAYDKNAN